MLMQDKSNWKTSVVFLPAITPTHFQFDSGLEDGSQMEVSVGNWYLILQIAEQICYWKQWCLSVLLDLFEALTPLCYTYLIQIHWGPKNDRLKTL